MKSWQTDIENLIKHNVVSQISEIDLSECHQKKIITDFDEEPVRNGLQALADVSCLVVKILGHCKLDIFGKTTNGAITKCIRKYRVGIYM